MRSIADRLVSDRGSPSSVGAVLLAAGGGSRFLGSNDHKLLAPFRGRPLCAWSLGAMAHAGFDAMAVVWGAADLSPLLVSSPVDAVFNGRWQEGQAASLQAAIGWARQLGLDAVVVGLADQPLVPSTAWQAVAKSSGAIVTAEFDGRRRPPVRLAKSVWDQLPTTGDDGARALMRANPDLVKVVSCVGNPADIDTLEDLDQWS